MNEIIKIQQTQASIAASRNYQESLKIWEGNTSYGNLALFISSNMTHISKFAETAGQWVGRKAVDKIRDKQYFNPVYGEFKNFLSRNIYLSRQKKNNWRDSVISLDMLHHSLQKVESKYYRVLLKNGQETRTLF